MNKINNLRDLKPGTWMRQGEAVTVCFDLARGKSVLKLASKPPRPERPKP